MLVKHSFYYLLLSWMINYGQDRDDLGTLLLTLFINGLAEENMI